MGEEKFRIGDWQVDPKTGRVFRGGQETRLEPKAMEVLLYLAQHAGEMVTRQELEENVWTGTVVSYEALSVTINKIRKAFQDDSRQSKYIETLAKRGYRLVAPVSNIVTDNEAVPRSSIQPPASKIFPFNITLPSLLMAIFVLVIPLGLGGYYLFDRNDSPISSMLDQTGPSIAVLPFSNISGNPEQDYIAYGLTEDIITDLSRVSRLLVISRSSVAGYTGQNPDLEEINSIFGVHYILTGSVRKASDRLRIAVQLVDTRNNRQVWGERYDRSASEFVTVQDEITQKIVSALVIRLTNEEQIAITRHYTNNLEAHDYYLRGRALYNSITKEGNNLARKMFAKAIELDPDFARAYGAMALTYVDDYRRKWSRHPTESAEQALKIARQAVQIDNSAAVPHWVLGYVYLYGKKNPDKAISSAEKAILLNPNYADAYALLASAYSFNGRSDDAIRLNRHAMKLNPTSSVVYYANLGRDLYFKDNLDEATKTLQEAINKNYNYINAHLYLAATLARKGDLEEAAWVADDIRSLDSKFSLAYWAETQPYSSGARLERMVADLKKAGVPN